MKKKSPQHFPDFTKTDDKIIVFAIILTSIVWAVVLSYMIAHHLETISHQSFKSHQESKQKLNTNNPKSIQSKELTEKTSTKNNKKDKEESINLSEKLSNNESVIKTPRSKDEKKIQEILQPSINLTDKAIPISVKEEIVEEVISPPTDNSNNPEKELNNPNKNVETNNASELFIGSFFIDNFNKVKLFTEEISNTIIKIIQRYDLISIQGIQSSKKDLEKFLKDINKQTNSSYKFILSKRAGRSKDKEKYAYFYKKDIISVIDSYTYDDGSEKENNDIFEREPFIGLFKFGEHSFSNISIHTHPNDSENEIDDLQKVYTHHKKKSGNSNILLMGNMYADCDNVKDNIKNQLSLFKDTRFYWFINDDQDTSTLDTHCAYDRLIGSEEILNNHIQNSSQVFLFDKEFNVNNELTKKISSHYPVEMKLAF